MNGKKEQAEQAEEQEQPTVERFQLKRAEETIELELEDGTIGEYVIREMTGSMRDSYLKELAMKADVDGTGNVVRIKDPTGIQTALVSRCLFDSSNKAVGPAFVNNLPSSVQARLNEKCAKINQLEKKSVQDAKND
jgi:hypothetical protein